MRMYPQPAFTTGARPGRGQSDVSCEVLIESAVKRNTYGVQG
jgi:hypothetical protein